MRYSQVTILTGIVLGLSLLGLLDAIYLSAKALSGNPVVCNLVNGCSVVLQSNWANILGIPTAVYGLGYYSILAVFAGAYLQWRDHIILQSLAITSTLGLLVSGWLVYLQLGPLAAVCEYCMFSAVITLGVCSLVWRLVYLRGWYNEAYNTTDTS